MFAFSSDSEIRMINVEISCCFLHQLITCTTTTRYSSQQ
ncbi:hypothetical protein OIU76_001725, partial [Salix suchowensis]